MSLALKRQNGFAISEQTLASAGIKMPKLETFEKLCYCHTARDMDEPEFNCKTCRRWVHRQCMSIKFAKSQKINFTLDYEFECKFCTRGAEDLVVFPAGYCRMAVTILAILRQKYPSSNRFFDFMTEILPILDSNWTLLTPVVQPSSKKRAWFLLKAIVGSDSLFEYKLFAAQALVRLKIDLADVSPYNENIMKITQEDIMKHRVWSFTIMKKFVHDDPIKNHPNIRSDWQPDGFEIECDAEPSQPLQYRFVTGIKSGYFSFTIEIIEIGEESIFDFGVMKNKGPRTWFVDNQPLDYGYKLAQETELERGFQEGDKIGLGLYLPFVEPENIDGENVTPGSTVHFVKNGVMVGRQFSNLYDANYYPAITFSGKVHFRIKLDAKNSSRRQQSVYCNPSYARKKLNLVN